MDELTALQDATQAELDALLPSVLDRALEAFQFLLATAMHEAGKFELLNVAEVDRRRHYTFSSRRGVFLNGNPRRTLID